MKSPSTNTTRPSALPTWIAGFAVILLLGGLPNTFRSPAFASETAAHGAKDEHPHQGSKTAEAHAKADEHGSAATSVAAHNEALPTAHREEAKAVDGVNPVLLESQSHTANTNLGKSTVPTRNEGQLEEWQIILDMARRFKREKNTAGAVEYFTKIIESGAPGDMKRTALLDLALLAQQEKQVSRAQVIFNDYVKTYPEDPSVPEILLRQGLLYREMGAPAMALSKFYSVMTTSLALKLDKSDYYKELVLKAQTEIADTYYPPGRCTPRIFSRTRSRARTTRRMPPS